MSGVRLSSLSRRTHRVLEFMSVDLAPFSAVRVGFETA